MIRERHTGLRHSLQIGHTSSTRIHGTRSRSQVEGLRINGRIWNIPCDFGHFSVILQNMLIPVSYILEITIKKVKFSLFS